MLLKDTFHYIVCHPLCCSIPVTKYISKLFGLWRNQIILELIIFCRKKKRSILRAELSTETQEQAQLYLINASLVLQTFPKRNKNNLKLLASWTIPQKVTADKSVPEQQSLLSSKWPEFFHFSAAYFYHHLNALYEALLHVLQEVCTHQPKHGNTRPTQSTLKA